MASEHCLILVNWLACSAGGLMCLCRMTKMSGSRTKFAIRGQYALWLCFFAASGWSFAFGHAPSFMQTMLSLITMSALALGVPAWRHDLPRYAHKE